MKNNRLKQLFVSTIMIIMIFTTVASAFAQDEDVVDEELNKLENLAPAHYYQDSGLVPSPTTSFFKSLSAVVNGALCSDYADNHGFFTPKTTQKCFENKDMIGKVYQAMTTYQDKPDKSIGEIQVSKGQEKCFKNLEPNKKYYWQVFYCNEKTIFCTKYEPKCLKSSSEYLAQIECTNKITKQTYTKTELVPLKEYGGVQITKVGKCDEQQEKIQKGTSNKAPVKVIPSKPEDELTTLPSTQELSGKFLVVNTPNNMKSSEKLTVYAEFQADSNGDYYLETYLQPDAKAALSIINVPQGGLCDSDTHTAGKIFKMKAGEIVQVSFTDIESRPKGQYAITVGAFSGCGVEAFTAVNKLVCIDNGCTTSSLTSSYKSYLGYGIVITLSLFGVSFLFKKNKRKK